MASKTQQTLHLPAGSSAQQKPDEISSKIRARQAYCNAVKKRLTAGKGLRPGSHNVNVRADVLKEMYVVGMDKDVLRITDLKIIVKNILLEFRVFHNRYMRGPGFNLLLHTDEYNNIARVFTDFHTR